ncbi:MAG: MBL fold metallo-hydrolase [Dietzia sp.]
MLAGAGARPVDPIGNRALVLTHGHFDHVGFARGAQKHCGTPVLGRELDSPPRWPSGNRDDHSGTPFHLVRSGAILRLKQARGAPCPDCPVASS